MLALDASPANEKQDRAKSRSDIYEGLMSLAIACHRFATLANGTGYSRLHHDAKLGGRHDLSRQCVVLQAVLMQTVRSPINTICSRSGVMNKVLMVNLAFWATAIAFPISIRLLPTSKGEMPKFFEFLVPLFQGMLGCGATYFLKSSIEKKPSNR